MAVNIVTGMTGRAHITSDDDRMNNASVFGTDKHVFEFGQQFRAEVLNNNEIRIRDGYCINQGTLMAVELSDYEDVVIDNGISGLNRHDLIVMRYEKNADTSLESARLVVVKGVQSNTPTDPAYQTGNILDGGDLVDDFPLYRVKIESLTIAEVEPLFEVWEHNLSNTFENVNGILHSIKNDVDKSLQSNKANVASQLEGQNRAVEIQLSAQNDAVSKQLSAQNSTVATMINEQKQRLEDQDENVNERLDEFGEILEPYQNGAVSGVKGNAESRYRTGNVNITPENLGLNNTKDYVKTVRALGKIGSESNGSFQEEMQWKGTASSVSKLNDHLLFARYGGSGGMYCATGEEIIDLLGVPEYEEGTFTPEWYKSASTKLASSEISNLAARYTKFGNICLIEAQLASRVDFVPYTIRNLPFPLKSRPNSTMPTIKLYGSTNECYVNYSAGEAGTYFSTVAPGKVTASTSWILYGWYAIS